MASIFKDIKTTFKKGSFLTRLIYVNIAFFLVIKILSVFSYLMASQSIDFIQFFGLAASTQNILSKPWTVLTHMFFHLDFVHLLFNQMMLYYSGRIFLSYLSKKQLLSTYVLGGLYGATFYVACYNLLPVFEANIDGSIAFGASASVLAILLAIATYVPNYKLSLTFIGNVKLKNIALFYIIMDILLIPKGNPGGHIAHLGGAFFGFYYIKRLQGGKDISSYFNLIMNYIVNAFKSNKSPLKTAYKRPKSDDQWRKEKKTEQESINLILDKIGKSGYESLNKTEKEILFKSSKK